ncbi:MAG: class I SAM-dependent methyltransferase [Mariprofundus sp.]|nr:class I SAM-dependent methyltransferase [Mariprofundus sp.]
MKQKQHRPVSQFRWRAAQKHTLEKWLQKDLQQLREKNEQDTLPLLLHYASMYPDSAAILEIGCGPICISQFLPQKNKTYLDPLLDDFRRLFPGKLPEGHFIASGAEKIDAPSSSFDLIICNHAIACSKNPELIMHEIERLLTPHGRLILTMTTHSALEARLHYFGECCAPSICHNMRPYYYALSGIVRTLERHFIIAQEMTGHSSYAQFPLFKRVERTFVCTLRHQEAHPSDPSIPESKP